MKISEVTITDLKQYANVYHNLDDTLFQSILIATKYFISNYTGIPLVDIPQVLNADGTVATDAVNGLDHFEDLTIALLILSNEMYDNRVATVEFNKVGFVIKQLLDSHSTNLL